MSDVFYIYTRKVNFTFLTEITKENVTDSYLFTNKYVDQMERVHNLSLRLTSLQSFFFSPLSRPPGPVERTSIGRKYGSGVHCKLHL